MSNTHRITFPGLASYVIKRSFWSVEPSYIKVYLRNGQTMRYDEASGFSWERKRTDCVLYGWTVTDVQDFARLNGTVLPLENLLRYCFGPPEPVVQPPNSPLVIPDVPLDEFSCEWLSEGTNNDLAMDLHDEGDEERLHLGYDVGKLFIARRKLVFE